MTMAELLTALVGLLAAGIVLWVRRTHVRRGWVRILLLVIAALLAYPALNACYIAAKRFIASP